MKIIKYNLLALSIFALISCGNEKTVDEIIASGNEQEIQQKRDELHKQIRQMEGQLKTIDGALAKFGVSAASRNQTLVSVYDVKDTVFNHYLDLQGSVKTDQNITLNAEFSGVLEKIYVKKGQYVQQGQLLASIQDGGAAQQLAQLQVQAELAKTTYERQARLWENKIGSEIQFLQAKSAYETQKSAVEQMKKQYSKTQIYAPFSGTIDDVLTDVGSVVAPGMAVFRLVNLSNMYLEVEVPEQHIARIEKGSEAMVSIPVLGKKWDLKVNQASNYINPDNRSFKITIHLPNKNGEVKPNMTARLQVKDYHNDKAILLPLDVISENADGEQYAFIAKPEGDKAHTAEKILITTGKTQNGLTEVLSGIAVGDKVIKEGARSVQPGQHITF